MITLHREMEGDGKWRRRLTGMSVNIGSYLNDGADETGSCVLKAGYSNGEQRWTCSGSFRMPTTRRGTRKTQIFGPFRIGRACQDYSNAFAASMTRQLE